MEHYSHSLSLAKSPSFWHEFATYKCQSVKRFQRETAALPVKGAGSILSEDPYFEQRQIAIVGNEPEALLLSVLFSEEKIPTYLVGPFEGFEVRNPGNARDEAQWLLHLHTRNDSIRQLADPDDLPSSKIHSIIVTGHATTQSETSELERTVHTVSKNLQIGSNFIFSGLCRPGYTLGTIGETIEKHSGMSIDSEVGLGYLPLLWNGEQIQDVRDKPIIMAATSERVASRMQDMFLRIFPAITCTTKIGSAEAAGLFAPIYREVVGALELELASLCQNERVDYREAADLCRVSGLPRLGAPRSAPARDTLASIIALSTIGARDSRLIRAAKRVNEHAPSQIFALIKGALALCGRRVRHSKIAILGLDGLQPVSRLKPSPPQILNTLRRRGATVSLYPGETTGWTANAYSESVNMEKSVSNAIRKANCAVIALDKPSEADLNPQILASEMARPGAVCDLTRVLEASNVERAGLFYTSIGRGSPGS